MLFIGDFAVVGEIVYGFACYLFAPEIFLGHIFALIPNNAGGFLVHCLHATQLLEDRLDQLKVISLMQVKSVGDLFSDIFG